MRIQRKFFTINVLKFLQYIVDKINIQNHFLPRMVSYELNIRPFLKHTIHVITPYILGLLIR